MLERLGHTVGERDPAVVVGRYGAGDLGVVVGGPAAAVGTRLEVNQAHALGLKRRPVGDLNGHVPARRVHQAQVLHEKTKVSRVGAGAVGSHTSIGLPAAQVRGADHGLEANRDRARRRRARIDRRQRRGGIAHARVLGTRHRADERRVERVVHPSSSECVAASVAAAAAPASLGRGTPASGRTAGPASWEAPLELRTIGTPPSSPTYAPALSVLCWAGLAGRAANEREQADRERRDAGNRVHHYLSERRTSPSTHERVARPLRATRYRAS